MADRYIDEDGIFTAPAIVADLNDIPEGFRDMYHRSARAPGKFALTREGAALAQWAREEVKKLKEEAAAAKTAAEAEIAAIRAERKTTAIQSSLRSGLMSEGVKPTLANAAAALMESAFRFEVEEADDGDGSTVLVHTDFGLHSVADAVRAFLQSDDGAPFRSGRQIAAGGMFSAMLASRK